MKGSYGFGMFVGSAVVTGVLTEQKLESKFSEYLSYLPKNPSCSKIPEESAFRGESMTPL